MADDKFKNDGDDEYEFTASTGEESENDFENTKFVSPTQAEMMSDAAGGSNTMRNVIIACVVAGLGFAGYKLATVYMAPKPNTDLMMAKNEDANKQANFEAFLKPAPKEGTTQEFKFDAPPATTNNQPVAVETKPEPTKAAEATVETKPEEKTSVMDALIGKKTEAVEKTVEKDIEKVVDKLEPKANTMPEKTTGKVVMPEIKTTTTKTEMVKTDVTKTEPNKVETTKTVTPVAVQTTTNVTMSKDLEKKLSMIVEQTAASQESLRKFESNIHSMQQTMSRMNQRMSDMDEEMRQMKMQPRREAIEADIRERLKAELARARPEPVRYQPQPRRAAAPAPRPVAPAAQPRAAATTQDPFSCYKLDSITPRAVILVRQDNSQRYEISPGGRFPRLRKDEGRCVDTGDTIILQGFNVDRGTVTAGGQLVDTSQFYVIGALIEGRAWLKTENGTTITVDRGSILPGYGRVTVIDPAKGIVRTSSGKTIQFSAEER